MPTQVPTGGNPNGYIALTTPKFRLGSKNLFPAWTGNYSAAGITGIEMDAKVFSGSALSLRVMISTGADAVVLTDAVPVAADGAWHHIRLSLNAADLTLVTNGAVSIDTVLANATLILIRHDDSPDGAPRVPSSPSIISGATVGFDNIESTNVEPPIFADGFEGGSTPTS